MDIFACMCIYVPCEYLVPEDQKKALDPLGLELQVVINDRVGARN